MNYEAGCIYGALVCGLLFLFFCGRIYKTTKEIKKLEKVLKENEDITVNNDGTDHLNGTDGHRLV